MDRLLIFGTGRAYKFFQDQIELNDDECAISALLDNDEGKQGTIIDGIMVYSPQDVFQLEYNYIVVLGKYADEMMQQLVSLGVRKSSILTCSSLYLHKRWFKPKKLSIKCNQNAVAKMMSNSNHKYVILFTALIYAGGPLAILSMAKVLIKNGYLVIIVAADEGPAEKEYVNLNVPVIIDKNIRMETLADMEWIPAYSMIVVNGIQSAPMLMRIPQNRAIVWWLHDPEAYYGLMNFSFESLNLQGINVCAVSELAWQPIKKRFPYLEKRILLYGVPNIVKHPTNYNMSGKIVFAVLGKIHEIKGQDILVKAVSMMDAKKRAKCEFWIIGNDDTEFAVRLKHDASGYQEIRFMGEFDRDGMADVFPQISVVVTPSRADMMPTANAEAFMYGIPCIISKNTGMAPFIVDGKNGILFETNDANELAAKMEWCVDHRAELKRIGQQGKRIFENKFDMKVFEKNVLMLANSCFE